MDLTREALQYLDKRNQPTFEEVHGILYADKEMLPIEPPQITHLRLNNLAGLVNYLNMDEEYKGTQLMVNVLSPETVEVWVPLEGFHRQCLVEVQSLNRFETIQRHLNSYKDMESMLIFLNTSFEDSEDRKVLINLLSNVVETTVRTSEDDGVTQIVTVRDGISLQDIKEVPALVELSPYVTFPDIEQPKMKFYLRMRNGPEASLNRNISNLWAINCMKRIADYLREHIQREKTQVLG